MRGKWVDQWYDTASSGGRFVRQDSRFRSWVGEDGDFLPAAGRYHLYISWACPWAHRTLIYRALKGLKDAISVTVVNPLMLSNGWVIAADADPVNHAQFLWQVYAKADPDYIGRATVPVLWDRRRETIVNNESSEIIRMFDAWPGARGPLFRPPELASSIDALNAEIYPAVNNGVYRAGFATTQAAYEEAYRDLFAMLDRLERRLGEGSFLLGEQVTKRTGGCLRRCCALIRCITATSSAIATAWWIFPSCGTTCARFIRYPASPRRYISTISRRTTTAATTPSIRPASSPPAPVSIFPCRLDAQCQSSAADRTRHANDIDAGSLTSSAISHAGCSRARRLRVPDRPCPAISPCRQCRSWPSPATDSQQLQEILG